MPVNERHTLVLDGSGNHYFACGNNDYGQLGTGECYSEAKFTKVTLPIPFISISAGFHHSLGLSECGSLWSWGANDCGQLGHDEGISFLSKPTEILNTHSFIQISTGYEFSLALDSFGCVWSFGSGFGNCDVQFTPTRMPNLPKIKCISAGGNFGLTLDHSGTVWSFGINHQGQLGLGDYDDREFPSKMEGVPKIVQVSSGNEHGLILDDLGFVWSFGYNHFGQLAQKGRNYSLPTKIQDLKDITHIIAAGCSSIVMNDQQQVFVFGANYDDSMEYEHGQIAEQKNWKNKIIIPGGFHALVIDELGNLFSYGCFNEEHGIQIPPLGLQEGIFVEPKKPWMKKASQVPLENASVSYLNELPTTVNPPSGKQSQLNQGYESLAGCGSAYEIFVNRNKSDILN
jgi:alpha-tubulin suppressor-like RCC1 family protein